MSSGQPKPSNSVVPVASLLYICAAGYGLVRTRQMGLSGFLPTSVLISIPTTATALFLVASLLVPSLVVRSRVVFPLNLTLPVVFASMMLVSLVLWTESRTPLFAISEALRPARFWNSPGELLRVALIQAAALTLVAAIARGRAPSPTSPTPESPAPLEP